MKNTFRPRTVAALLAGWILLSALPASAAPEVYDIDSSHANIVFRISHFGFSKPDGKFPNATGILILDEQKPEDSKVNVSIPVKDLVTGIPKLDEHLQAADFFDTAKFPTATFSSTKVEKTGEKTAKVTGDLTLRGVTKPVVLDVTLNKIAPNMFKMKTAGFSATTTLKRSDFGMVAYLPDLGDEVTLSIELEANVQNQQTNK